MNKSIVTAVLLLILIASLVGCSSTGSLRQDSAEDQYELAKNLYERGKYYKAADAFRVVIFNYSGVSYIDSVQYYLGMCYFNDDDYILAVAEFRRLVRNFPHSPLADDAQLMIAKCYYLSAPKNIGLDQSDTYTAITELENFIEDFPQSPLLNEANELLNLCRSKIAKKIFKNGEQYYKLGNYKSARIYLEKVVTDFQSSEWRGCALYLLAAIDEKQNKFEDAEAKLANFLEVFHGHKWEKKATSKLDKIRTKLGNTSARSDAK